MRRGVTHSCGHHWSYDGGPLADRATEEGLRKREYVERIVKGPCPRRGQYDTVLNGFEDDPAKWRKPDFVDTKDTIGPPGMWTEED